MKTLQGLAREKFEEFAIRETGRTANWDYLSDERKLRWMKDIFKIASYLVHEIMKDFKPLRNEKASTSFEAGYNEGVRSERASHITIISQIQQTLVDELCDFEDSIKNK